MKYYQSYGEDWKLIAKHLPGRTEFMLRKRLAFLEEKYPNLFANEQSGKNEQNNDFNFFGNEEQDFSSSFLFEDAAPSSANQNNKDFNSQFLIPEADFFHRR